MITSDLLKTQMASYAPPEGVSFVAQACALAEKAHAGYLRRNDETYILHPLRVALTLAGWQAPPDVVAAGVLHDVHKARYAAAGAMSEVEACMGATICNLVQEVSHLARSGTDEHFWAVMDEEPSVEMIARRLPWFAGVLDREPHAVVIKLAACLDNFATIEALPDDRRQQFARIVLRIYVPFAERLGMHQVKRELEDGAFAVLQPDAFRSLQERYAQDHLLSATKPIREALERRFVEHGIQASVQVAPASLYSLHRQEAERSPREPATVLPPVLVLLPPDPSCYEMLSHVHALWKPMSGGLRDYIAEPKINGYRALHTTLRYPSGQRLVVILRDETMHLLAEHGQTAVWRGIPVDLLPPRRPWRPPEVGQIAVFSREGEVCYLPEDATPVDFAYAIHPELGNQMSGAVVNGESAPLSIRLVTGDVVKVLTSGASVGPSAAWLDFVKTGRAKREIRRWLKAKNLVAARERGWRLLERQLREHGATLSAAQVMQMLRSAAQAMDYDSEDAVLQAIGLDLRKPDKVLEQMWQFRAGRDELPLQATILSLSGANRSQRLANCCSPQPPDDIVGYVNQKTRQVIIHRADCGNVKHRKPLLNAEWPPQGAPLRHMLEITAADRRDLVYDISGVMREFGVSMGSFHADRIADGSARVEIGLDAGDRDQIEQIITRLKRVPGTRSAAPVRPKLPLRHARGAVIERTFVNPYSIRPVSGEGFYGRREELEELVSHVRDRRPGQAVLLWGPRRIGKTSLLLQFQQLVLSHEDYLVAYVDMQRLTDRTTSNFLFEIMRSITTRVANHEISTPRPSRMRRDPLAYFQSFMEGALPRLDRQLVLMLDEFHLLTELQETIVSVEAINRYFRSLIQSGRGLYVLFAGGGVLEELLAQAATVPLLEIAHENKLGFLERNEARSLIVEPAPQVDYAPTIVEQILDITHCHPYYLQYLCSELVALANRTGERALRPAQLETIIDDQLPEWGPQFFAHLWGDDTVPDLRRQQTNRMVLVALAEDNEDRGWLPFSALQSRLRGIVSDHTLWETLTNLVKMDTLDQNLAGDSYHIRIPLFELWLRANYKSAHLIRELPS